MSSDIKAGLSICIGEAGLKGSASPFFNVCMSGRNIHQKTSGEERAVTMRPLRRLRYARTDFKNSMN